MTNKTQLLRKATRNVLSCNPQLGASYSRKAGAINKAGKRKEKGGSKNWRNYE